MLVLPSSLARTVIGRAIEVHRHLGPGLLESTYARCLGYELDVAGVPYQAEVPVPVQYKGVRLECGYRIDLIVDDALLIEIKSVNRFHPIHHAQVITYLKLMRLEQGLLINFNVPRLVDGLKNILIGGRAFPNPSREHR